jgi:hypothetical protein
MTMAPRYSLLRSDHIEYSFWLAFGFDGSVSLSRAQPSLTPNQRAMSLVAKLPLTLFRTPQLKATINVAADGQPDLVVDVEAAAEALTRALGVDVEVRRIGEGS